jgi:hypothetical protein
MFGRKEMGDRFGDSSWQATVPPHLKSCFYRMLVRLDMSRERMRTARTCNKPRALVIQVVKRLSTFGIKSQRHLLPIVISPCSSVNRQQADVKVREHLPFRNAMQFRKSQDGH